MQEHLPRQASQRRRQRIVGHTPAQIFEISLEVDAPSINEII
jgi:hypothetical protein